MPCAICSETCGCPSESPLSAQPRATDSSPWRQELAERLQRYHSRRKPRPPRYPSLRFQFEVLSNAGNAGEPSPQSQPPPQAVSGFSHHAVALQAFDAEPDGFFERSQMEAPEAPRENASLPAPVTAKILEFPRSPHDLWAPPAPRLDELAEPAFLPPRILEVPEVAPPPPALGGITIEPAKKPDYEKRPGIDIPLRAATLGRRGLSAAFDAVIIAAHCALFSFIFWKLTAMRPPRLQIAGVLAGLALVLWAAYQYLLLVYTGTTPGLRLAKLRLARFDGSPASRKLRRWRVLASFLSALSLGMGYVWVFLDEDSLCWHDRITHTYLEENK